SEWGRIHVSSRVAFPEEKARYHQVGPDRYSVITGLRVSNERSSVKRSPLPLVPMLVYMIRFSSEWGRIHVSSHVAFPDENVRYRQVGPDRYSVITGLRVSNERSSVKRSPLPLVPMLVYMIRFSSEWGRIHVSSRVAFPEEKARYHQVGPDRYSVITGLRVSNERSSVKRSPLPLVPMLVYMIRFSSEWGRIHVSSRVAFPEEKARYHQVGPDR
ncbi:hypothetical protein GN958_ATG22745, partial [Phytophthora infestans]